MSSPANRSVRCAIYTRVSTDAGLDQEFGDRKIEAAMGTAPRNEDFRRLNATKTLPGSLTRTVAIINPDNPTPGTKDTFLPRAGAFGHSTGQARSAPLWLHTQKIVSYPVH